MYIFIDVLRLVLTDFGSLPFL